MWEYRELCMSLALGSQGCKKCSLAWGNIGIPHTGMSLVYTINPFGPSAGRVFIFVGVILVQSKKCRFLEISDFMHSTLPYHYLYYSLFRKTDTDVFKKTVVFLLQKTV